MAAQGTAEAANIAKRSAQTSFHSMGPVANQNVTGEPLFAKLF